MFKCLGWPCPTTFICLLFETPIVTLLSFCARNTWCGTWYSERVILQFMSVGSWAGVTYLRYTELMSSNKSETAVHCCDPALSVLVMLVSCSVLLLETFLADQIFCRSYIGSVYRIRSLAVSELKHARFWDADGNRNRTFHILGPYCLPDFYATHL